MWLLDNLLARWIMRVLKKKGHFKNYPRTEVDAGRWFNYGPTTEAASPDSQSPEPPSDAS
jgi:hypothetical protein